MHLRRESSRLYWRENVTTKAGVGLGETKSKKLIRSKITYSLINFNVAFCRKFLTLR